MTPQISRAGMLEMAALRGPAKDGVPRTDITVEGIAVRRYEGPRRGTMKSAGEIMEILEAFDLTGWLRDAGELAGCSHHTVARYVSLRDAGSLSDQPAARPQLIDRCLPKVEDWVEKSKGKIRADIAHASSRAWD